MWVLIYIVISSGVVDADKISTFPTLNECFAVREDLLIMASQEAKQELNGYFPPGQQAVCIWTNDYED